ncbi:MAG: hypothetical protein GY700_04495, partial [Propionibacteriaceae bacterium]|nr:hypothetical protein [Propionibacteriaceae bacterium]
EVPDSVLQARDAALYVMGERHAAEAPATGMTWTAENITPGWPDRPVPGQVDYRFTADEWVVSVSYAVLPPEQTIYHVVVTNQATQFEWRGEVDAAGQVAEQIAPDEVRAALHAVMAYVSEYYSDQPALEPGQIWMEERTTPEGWVGSTTYEFTTGDWVVTITDPVLPPERIVRGVVVANESTGFRWDGKVDAVRNVSEASALPEPVMDIQDPGQALQVALAYLSERHGEQVPAIGLTWVGDRPPAEDLVGSQTINFTSESAPGWLATVTYGVVAPEAVVYQMVLIDETSGFQWEGEVDASGQVTELAGP